MRVGSKGTIFYVHRGVFASFPSSAMYARVLGSWKETSNEEIDLREFDEHTISCALSYFYVRNYHPFLELGQDAEKEAEKETCEVSETESVPNDCLGDGQASTFF